MLNDRWTAQKSKELLSGTEHVQLMLDQVGPVATNNKKIAW